MARPTTKLDLIEGANKEFFKMWQIIDTMPQHMVEAQFEFGSSIKDDAPHWQRDKNIRDVLIHLYEWHQLLLNWVDSNLNGDPKPFIPEPYNWKSYGQMNVEFTKSHLNTALDQSMIMLKTSHEHVLAMIEGLSNEELFAKDSFKWTKGTTLGSYCVSASSSHYAWAIKKLKLHVKTQTNLHQ